MYYAKRAVRLFLAETPAEFECASVGLRRFAEVKCLSVAALKQSFPILFCQKQDKSCACQNVKRSISGTPSETQTLRKLLHILLTLERDFSRMIYVKMSDVKYSSNDVREVYLILK